MSTRTRKYIFTTTALGVAFLTGWYLFSFSSQLSNSVLLQTHARALRLAHERGAEYPESPSLLDHWSREILFISDRNGFIVASAGRDGVFDRTYKQQHISTTYETWESNCFTPNADTIFTAAGPVQACLK